MLNVTYNQAPSASIDKTIRDFQLLYYHLRTPGGENWQRTSWMGINILKYPSDLWIYQELISWLKPDLLIETGTWSGGSALYLSHLCDLVGKGEVLSIDLSPQPNLPQHPRLTYITGSSTAPAVMVRVRQRAHNKQTIMVILDSDHTAPHVLHEMQLYHPLVTPGSYLIVEDSNINGHPAAPGWGPGPMEAVMQFMQENRDFEIDKECEKLLLTANPNGYLRKRGGPPKPAPPHPGKDQPVPASS
jgi:cephalosporin hydroxylase